MQNRNPNISMALSGDFSIANTGSLAAVQGKYRFLKVKGKIGFHPMGLEAYIMLQTNIHQGNEGSIHLCVCPLEDLDTAPAMSAFMSKDPFAQEYPLITDGFPAREPSKSIFGWYWRAAWHPQMVAKFKVGAAGGGNADYGVTPYVPVEHLPLYSKQWYLFTLTWSHTEHRMKIYINGVLAGISTFPFKAAVPNPTLYIGNSAMVFSDLKIYDTELSQEDILLEYGALNLNIDQEVNAELQSLYTVEPKKKENWAPDISWDLKYQAEFKNQTDLACWSLQGCTKEPFKIKELKTTPEGLLIQTPDQIDLETRMYLWSNMKFEGDLAVRFDFRPEQDSGLALLVLQASGMNREDFIEDHPTRTTGAMTTIVWDRVRNYHWEFFRKAVDVRCDLGTQILVKNPYQRPLGMKMIPPYEIGKWYQLLFLQEGNRIRASINGEWIFDITDSPSINTGAVFNYGRIGIRLMYHTKMRFKNLQVWNRNPDVEIV